MSHPVGEWQLARPADIQARVGNAELTFIWDLGHYVVMDDPRPTEVCAGSEPNTYHVRLADPE